MKEKYLKFIDNINIIRDDENKIDVIVKPLNVLMRQLGALPDTEDDLQLIEEMIKEECPLKSKDEVVIIFSARSASSKSSYFIFLRLFTLF